MQLLDYWVLNVVLTTLFVSVGISLLVSVATIWVRPRGSSFWATLSAALAFSLLGFVTGDLMGNSREAAVGAVLPAVLTLLGGVAAYIISSKGVRSQVAISAMLVCFTLSFVVGSLFGSRLRVEYEFALQDPKLLLNRELALLQNKLAVDAQRLKNYVTVQRLREDFSKQNAVDLSRFESALEKLSSGKTEEQSESALQKTPKSEGKEKTK